MSEFSLVPMSTLGRDFVPPQYLPDGQDEYFLRNEQSSHAPGHWRPLEGEEIERLVKNGNTADDWNDVLVAEGFNPHHVHACQFSGLVRLGRMDDVALRHHDLQMPVGITNSRIIACDIGDNAAVHHVRYLAHTIVADEVMLLNIDEMHTTNHAKFGNGFLKDGEGEDVLITLDLGNEAGGREVQPFVGMTCADATLWARYRDDGDLIRRLGEITQGRFDSRRGYYGQVGRRAVVKNCRIIKDVRIGPSAYIKGANKLKNLTVESTDAEPTQIGEGVEMVNGIVSRGCHIFYGCKAVRFVMAPCSNLKYGARLIHSYLGDNSTVSCCEILNNLIFPAHEQHHNNSFLIASTVMGQSNIAAGATVGSNHNSRAPDGEILAGRGFWPGLCVTLKHSCRFASFNLLAKGDYPAELAVPLPFALLSNHLAGDELRIMPAYWWMYNMYALMRNSWKFAKRDKRATPVQHIEFDFLAPDTAEEMLRARDLLAEWVGKARATSDDTGPDDPDNLRNAGRELLEKGPDALAGLAVLADGVEHSRRPVRVLKAPEGWAAYGEMLLYYAVRNLLDWMGDHPGASCADMADALSGPRVRDWTNLGGQIIANEDIDHLRKAIRDGQIDSWDDIHAEYDRLWDAYPLQKQRHAFATLLELLGEETLTTERFGEVLDTGLAIQQMVADRTRRSRQKDFENTFRRNTFRNDEEMRAVVGTIDDNSFVHQQQADTEAFANAVEEVRSRG